MVTNDGVDDLCGDGVDDCFSNDNVDRFSIFNDEFVTIGDVMIGLSQVAMGVLLDDAGVEREE